MQQRLALTVAKFNKLVTPTTRNTYFLHRSLATSGGAEGRTADPDVHAGMDPEDSYTEERPLHTPTKEQPPMKENDPFVDPKPPHSPSPKLESNPVNQPSDPIKQQRRRFSVSEETVKDVWPEDDMDRQTQIRERVKDDQEYFKHHKASPLSEIELADTRKPVAQAMDGSGGGDSGSGGGGVVAESAEDTLLRAKRMFMEAATRGDPDSPHGRVLRELRGEYW